MNRYEEKLNALQSVGMLRSLPQVERRQGDVEPFVERLLRHRRPDGFS